MKTGFAFCIFVAVVLTISGCKTRPEKKAAYDSALLPGRQALRRITDPEAIPDFTLACLHTENLAEAIDNSLEYLSKPSSRHFFPCCGITHHRTVASLEEFKRLLDSHLPVTAFSAAVRERFEVYMSVGCDNNGTVLFTGYYTPIFDGSAVRSGRFRYPLYTPPANLVKGPYGEIQGLRGPDGRITAVPPRSEIDRREEMRGQPLVYLADPFEVYIAHVQGSAKIRLPDGKLLTVGYAASNGWEYRSVAKALVRDGRIAAAGLSLATIIDYFKRHRDQVDYYVRQNPRYVFFRKEAGNPRGSLNVAVTPMRSIATDKSIFPPGSLTFLSTRLPQDIGTGISQRVYGGFALDQDTGGAIRAAGRCDVYMGQGDKAGRLAGQTYQEGKLYYLFLKPRFVKAK